MDDITINIDQQSQALLTFLLAFIMFSVALGLHLPHFTSLLKKPKAIIYGLVGQLIALPMLTLGLIYVLNPAPSIALGMIVVASCPGGNVSNFFTSLSKGDVALSVTLTSVVSILAVITTPLAIIFWAGLNPRTASLLSEININVIDFLWQTTLILGVPLILGMMLAAKLPKLATRIGPLFRVGSFFILIFFIIALTYKHQELLVNFGAIILPLVILHNSLALFIGNMAGRMTGLGVATTRAITFEVGIQNSGLGLVILLTQFNGLGGAAMITATWGLWHIVSGLLLSLFYKHRDHSLGEIHHV